jgi:hypothetical protein
MNREAATSRIESVKIFRLKFGIVLAAMPAFIALAWLSHLLLSLDGTVEVGNELLMLGVLIAIAVGSCFTSTFELVRASRWTLRRRDLAIYLLIPLPYLITVFGLGHMLF